MRRKNCIIKKTLGLRIGVNSTHTTVLSHLIPLLSPSSYEQTAHNSPLLFFNFNLTHPPTDHLPGTAPKPSRCMALLLPLPNPVLSRTAHPPTSQHPPIAYYSQAQSCQPCYSPSSQPNQHWVLKELVSLIHHWHKILLQYDYFTIAFRLLSCLCTYNRVKKKRLNTAILILKVWIIIFKSINSVKKIKEEFITETAKESMFLNLASCSVFIHSVCYLEIPALGSAALYFKG